MGTLGEIGVDRIDELSAKLKALEGNSDSMAMTLGTSSKSESADDSPKVRELEKEYEKLKAKYNNLQKSYEKLREENKAVKDELGIGQKTSRHLQAHSTRPRQGKDHHFPQIRQPPQKVP